MITKLEKNLTIISKKKYMDIFKCLEKELEIKSNLVKKIYKNSIIYINSKPYTNEIINKNDTVDICFLDETDNIEAIEGKLDILYEDLDILVVNKPKGIAVHSNSSEKTMENILKDYFVKNNIKQKIRFLNRLDFNTTGILIIAKNYYAHSKLARDMEDGKTEKTYRCIVKGKVEKAEGIIELSISNKPDDNKRYYVTEEGQSAYTMYKVLSKNEEYSYLEVKLKTGRTHQIRVHMLAIGNPIYGDVLYGEDGDFLALHAIRYKIISPREKKEVQINAPINSDMKALLEEFGLDNIFFEN